MNIDVKYFRQPLGPALPVWAEGPAQEGPFAEVVPRSHAAAAVHLRNERLAFLEAGIRMLHDKLGPAAPAELAMLAEIANAPLFGEVLRQSERSPHVFEATTGWHFWDESGAHSHGPFLTEDEACDAMRAYGCQLISGRPWRASRVD